MSFPMLLGQVRDIPLEKILDHFGLTPRREGSTTRYKNDQFNIVVSPNHLWFDNTAAVGGRGAIDLALHLKCAANPRLATAVQVREAIDWLISFQPGVESMASATAEPKAAVPRESFLDQAGRLAIRDDARWPLARRYLLRTRNLPAWLVDEVYARQDLYASFSKSRPEVTGVCFVHRNFDGEPRGATIRNIVAEAGSSFSIGEKATAWFTLGDFKRADRIVAVEAPIDALSFAALQPADNAVVLAMSCAHVFPGVLQAAQERGWPFTVAFDNDAVGTTGWQKCCETHRRLYPNDPAPRRVIPAAKDWNADLGAAARRSRRRGLC